MKERDLFKNVRTRSGWFFRFCQIVLWPIIKLLWNVEVIGQHNIPKTGGLIVVSNHISNLDPPIFGICIRRPIHPMAKEELFRVPILGRFLKMVNSFPVKRGQVDIKTVKFAQKLIESGQVVGIFPEGTRSKDGKMGKARPGAGMLACLCQAPVVPMRIKNSDQYAKFKKITITVGKPIMPPSDYTKDDYLKFSQKLLDEIGKL